MSIMLWVNGLQVGFVLMFHKGQKQSSPLSCTICVGKTKALISCADCTADLRLCFRTGKTPVFS